VRNQEKTEGVHITRNVHRGGKKRFVRGPTPPLPKPQKKMPVAMSRPIPAKKGEKTVSRKNKKGVGEGEAT